MFSASRGRVRPDGKRGHYDIGDNMHYNVERYVHPTDHELHNYLLHLLYIDVAPCSLTEKVSVCNYV